MAISPATSPTALIKPNIGADYADDRSLGPSCSARPIPPTGDPEFAKQLIAESGEAAPTLDFELRRLPRSAEQTAAILMASLELAGFTINPDPIALATTTASSSTRRTFTGDFGTAGWGPDWPNASTIIAPLHAQQAAGTLRRSRRRRGLQRRVEDALTTLDRAEQATKWQALEQDRRPASVDHPDVLRPSARPSPARRSAPSSGLYQWPATARGRTAQCTSDQ